RFQRRDAGPRDSRIRRRDGTRAVEGGTTGWRARDTDDVRSGRPAVRRHRGGRRWSFWCRRRDHRVCASQVRALPLNVPETTPHSPLPIIIDTDPGIDDCLALLLALNSPELDVRGISVSYGNTVVENAFRNAV